MEDKNAVNYFLFNDRKSTLRCSFILVVLVLSLNCILVFLAFCPFSTPNTTLSHFNCTSFPFHSTLILQQFLPLLVSISNLFNLHSRPFSFQITSIFSPTFPFSFSTKNLFLHHLKPFAPKTWRLYRAIAMTLPHKSSAIISKKH